MHLDDEALRALVDHEPRSQSAVDHLAACAECRSRHGILEERTARIAASLETLEPGPAQAPRPASMAYAAFVKRRSFAEKGNATLLRRISSPRLRPLWVGLCLIAVFTVAFSFAPVRAWASDLLAQFRVKKITVVQVDNTRLTELIGNTTLAKQIGQLVSDSMNVTKDPGKPQVVPSAEEASRRVGFTVRLAGNRNDRPEITVQDGAAFDFVVNRTRAQTLLNEAGGNNIQLPASLDGARVQVTIPAGVSVAYGDCPKVSDDSSNGSPPRRFANCIMLIELPSPTVETPPNVDVQELAVLVLEFTGMTPEQARSLSQKVDWSSTLVVPLPRNGATYKELKVDGEAASLIQRLGDDVPQYVIVWIKDGIMHAVGGLGSDISAAVDIANSLK